MRGHPLATLLLLATCGAAASVSRPASSLDLSRGSPGCLFFVDEPSCIGCRRCAEVAPRTFEMEPEFGRARVVSQGGDDFESLREAIRTCPSECIHQVTAGELAVLERWREAKLDGVQRKHMTSRLVGASTPPAWWLPLRQAGGDVGGDWHPVISEAREETKATVDFMGAPAGGSNVLNIAEEDALALKHNLPTTAPIKSRADGLRVLREHKAVFLLVGLAFTLQGVEILTNDVYF